MVHRGSNLRVFAGPDRRTQKAAIIGHGNSKGVLPKMSTHKKHDDTGTIKLASSH